MVPWEASAVQTLPARPLLCECDLLWVQGCPGPACPDLLTLPSLSFCLPEKPELVQCKYLPFHFLLGGQGLERVGSGEWRGMRQNLAPLPHPPVMEDFPWLYPSSGPRFTVTVLCSRAGQASPSERGCDVGDQAGVQHTSPPP